MIVIDPFEEMLISELNKISGFNYEDISKLDKLPLETSLEVLEVLVGFACESQNTALIMLGRTNICKIDKQWLNPVLISMMTGNTEDCLN